VLAFNAAVTTTFFVDPITCVRTSEAADKVIELTAAYVLLELVILDELDEVELELELELELVLVPPQATNVSVKTEVVTNLKIFFIIKNHLLHKSYH